MTALWIAAAIFAVVIAAKINRVFTAPHDPDDYYDC